MVRDYSPPMFTVIDAVFILILDGTTVRVINCSSFISKADIFINTSWYRSCGLHYGVELVF